MTLRLNNNIFNNMAHVLNMKQKKICLSVKNLFDRKMLELDKDKNNKT